MDKGVTRAEIAQKTGYKKVSIPGVLLRMGIKPISHNFIKVYRYDPACINTIIKRKGKKNKFSLKG
jgi:hypothetical protein